ncbi:MAG TPA: flagellar hook capping FlgD N-terminal domain-containing protein [Candidatus Sulfotelmatobacter sp.]|nr:flagellar hook capping FlgD N-terminal domain-containing protein [Candidatus Sulfotelmatobacter sp.]
MNTINASQGQAASSAAVSSHDSNAALPSSQGLNNMFLQLLVAQLQNQSPLNPMDPTQFVGQLAQFSELSEVTNIDQLLQQNLSTNSGSGSNPPAQGHSATLPISSDAPVRSVSSAAAVAHASSPASHSPSRSQLNHPVQGVF